MNLRLLAKSANNLSCYILEIVNFHTYIRSSNTVTIVFSAPSLKTLFMNCLVTSGLSIVAVSLSCNFCLTMSI